MASNREWLQPGKIVEHRVFGESRIVSGDAPAKWVGYQYKMDNFDGTFDWSAVHVDHENYFREPTK